jgi:hypothetical protein
MTTAATLHRTSRADAIAKAVHIAHSETPNTLLLRALELLADVYAARAKSAKLVAKARAGRGGLAPAVLQHDDLLKRLRSHWGPWDRCIVQHHKSNQTYTPNVIRLAELAADEFVQAVAEMRSDIRAARDMQPLAPGPHVLDLESLLR